MVLLYEEDDDQKINGKIRSRGHTLIRTQKTHLAGEFVAVP